MPRDESAPPPPDEPSSSSEAEEAAWEIATAETLRARGELAQAAQWYRRAANHLMECGEDERAISIAKLAAELAALDDAGKPPSMRESAVPDRPRTSTTATTIDPFNAKPVAAPAPPVVPAIAAQPKLEPLPAPLPAPAPANPAPEPPLLVVPMVTPDDEEDVTIARKAPQIASNALQLPAEPKPAEAKSAVPLPRPLGVPAPPRPQSKVPAPVIPPPARPSAPPSAATVPRIVPRPGPAIGTSAGPPRPQTRAPSAEIPPDTSRIDLGAIASPLAAMVDEAVSRIEETPQRPLSTAPEARRSGFDAAFQPARSAESERIVARLPAITLFAELPARALRPIAQQTGVVKLKAGDHLCESGGPEGPLYVLLSGHVYVGVAGFDAPAGILGPGEFVGEIAALYGGPRTATVVAREEVEVLPLAPTLVRALAKEHPVFHKILDQTARTRMRDSLPLIAPFFRRFSETARKELFRAFDFLTLEEGTLLFCEGSPLEAMYLVAGGELELYGGAFPLNRPARARVGEVVGLHSIAAGEPAGTSARAVRTSLLAALPRARFNTLANTHPSLAEAAQDPGVPGRGVVC